MTVTTYSRITSTAEADGSWEVQFAPRAGFVWTANHIAVSCPQYSSGTLDATVLIDGVFWCGSKAGQGDAADGTPLVIRSSQLLTVRWVSYNGGVVFSSNPTFTASVIVDEVQR